MNILNFLNNYKANTNKLNISELRTILNLLFDNKIDLKIDNNNKKSLQIAEVCGAVEYVIPVSDGSITFLLPGYCFLNETYIETILDDCNYGFEIKIAFMQAFLKELILANMYKIPEDLPDDEEILKKNILNLIGDFDV